MFSENTKLVSYNKYNFGTKIYFKKKYRHFFFFFSFGGEEASILQAPGRGHGGLCYRIGNSELLEVAGQQLDLDYLLGSMKRCLIQA